MGHSIEVMRICVYTWLSDIRLHWQDMKYLEDKIQTLRYRLDGLKSFSEESVSATKASDALTDGLGRLEALGEEWAAKAALYSSEYADAMEICFADEHSRAVWIHIIEHRPWADVGRQMGYSEPHIRRLGQSGIESIYERMPEEYRRYSIPNAV